MSTSLKAFRTLSTCTTLEYPGHSDGSKRAKSIQEGYSRGALGIQEYGRTWKLHRFEACTIHVAEDIGSRTMSIILP